MKYTAFIILIPAVLVGCILMPAVLVGCGDSSWERWVGEQRAECLKQGGTDYSSHFGQKFFKCVKSDTIFTTTRQTIKPTE